MTEYIYIPRTLFRWLRPNPCYIPLH